MHSAHRHHNEGARQYQQSQPEFNGVIIQSGRNCGSFHSCQFFRVTWSQWDSCRGALHSPLQRIHNAMGSFTEYLNIFSGKYVVAGFWMKTINNAIFYPIDEFLFYPIRIQLIHLFFIPLWKRYPITVPIIFLISTRSSLDILRYTICLKKKLIKIENQSGSVYQ